MASFAQESTRYCNYSGDKFGNELTFIRPSFWSDKSPHDGHFYKYYLWNTAMYNAEQSYLSLIKDGAKPEEARSVLPNSLKTEIVVTANYREWRHIFALRTSPKAHPQIREVMIPLMYELRERIPVVFENFEEDE
jgi:thymidylate synthase (FAD)